jgi:hypothetical protein
VPVVLDDVVVEDAPPMPPAPPLELDEVGVAPPVPSGVLPHPSEPTNKPRSRTAMSGDDFMASSRRAM